MSRSLIAVSLLLLLIHGALRAEEPFRDLNLEGALAAAKKEKKIVAVDFFATWCGPCKLMDRTTFKDAKVQEWIRDKAVAIKVDGDKNRKAVEKYRVSGFPTVVLLRPDGSEIERLVGYRPAADFLSQAAQALSGKDSLTRAREEMDRKEKPDPFARAQLAQGLAERGRNQEALAEYRWCLEKGAEADPGFANLAAGPLVGQIGELGKSYAPALDLLKARRETDAKNLLSGGGDAAAALQLVNIDRVLEQPQQTRKIYDELRKMGPQAAAIRLTLLREVLDGLLEDKRYADVLEDAGDLEKLLSGLFASYDSAVAQPVYRQAIARDPSLENQLKAQVVAEVAKFYEALAGSGRGEEASKLADRLIAFAPNGDTYSTLVSRALKADQRAAADHLKDRALRELPEDQREIVQKAATKG